MHNTCGCVSIKCDVTRSYYSSSFASSRSRCPVRERPQSVSTVLLKKHISDVRFSSLNEHGISVPFNFGVHDIQMALDS